MSGLSSRLAEIVDSLPLFDGIRVLEIGCGPGAAAREVAKRIGEGHILAIDRSQKAIRQAVESSQTEINSGRLSFRQVSIEDFDSDQNEVPFDLAFAVRVGALDGRHPEKEEKALAKVAQALTKNGKLFIDGGNPLREIPLEKFR